MEPGTLLINEWLMIIIFAAGMVVWGAVMHRQASRSLEASFLADRKLPGFIASLSTVATNMNANDFIGMAGAVYGAGIIMLHGPLINSVVIIFLSLVLMKRLRELNVFTLGEWLMRRYSKAVGNLYSVIWTFVWMPFNLGLYIYAGALIMNTLVGWNLYVAIVVVSVVAATYTLLGGFGAVVSTDVLQLLLMFFPFVFLAGMVWNEVGGPVSLLEALPSAKAELWHGETPFGPIGIMLFGMLMMSMSYWSSEAQIIQRPLSAKNPRESAITYLGAGFWYTLLLPLVVILPGLAAIKLYPGLENNDFAVPMLLKDFMPPGLYGVTIVGLLAGVFSSCDSQINAFCTMFTTDIYRGMIKQDVETDKLLRISRLAGVIFTIAAIGTAIIFTFARHGMFLFAIAIVGTIMPPFGAVTILGAVWRKANAKAALIGVCAGILFACFMLALELSGKLAAIAGDTLFFRAGTTFTVTLAITAALSLKGDFNYPRYDRENADEGGHGINNPRTLAIVLMGLVILIYIVVSFLSAGAQS